MTVFCSCKRKRIVLRSIYAGAISLLVACCGPSLPGTGESPLGEDVDVGVHRSAVARDVERPLLVEWPAVEKATLQAAASRGVVVVRYDGSALRVLDSCDVGGAYGFTETTRALDGFIVRNKTELYARLPLGAVKLEAEISDSDGLSLSYVAVGTRNSTVDSVSPDLTAQACAEATHFVRRMVVGAYELNVVAILGVGAGVDVGPAGIGGRHVGESRALRSNGDLQACLDDSTPAEDNRCQAIVQLVLEPIGSSAASSKESAKTKPVDVHRGGERRWAHCAVGQSWNGKSCPGLVYRMNWEEAMAACPSGMRLPTREELADLLEGCDLLVQKGEPGKCSGCSESEACSTTFPSPAIRRGAFWTSTVEGNSAFYVSFRTGNVSRTSNKSTSFSALCVRDD